MRRAHHDESAVIEDGVVVSELLAGAGLGDLRGETQSAVVFDAVFDVLLELLLDVPNASHANLLGADSPSM